MGYLFAVTLLWAFSFSLIGVYLAGQVDAWFSVLIRVALATMVFLPFLKPKLTSKPLALKLMLIGAVQLGVMYSFYYHSFLFLSVPEVLLFTVMTPLYITLLNDALNKHFNPRFFAVALIAVLGAVAIRWESLNSHFIIGLLLVQGANISFATGQVTYKRLMATNQLDDKTVFGWFFYWRISSGECLLRFIWQYKQVTEYTYPVGYFNIFRYCCLGPWLLFMEQRSNKSKCGSISRYEQRAYSCRYYC
jgi:drug/metabolite transporter (DMT)-like permease